MHNSISPDEISMVVDQLRAASNNHWKPGETRHVDHTACPSGRDTRGRLYITRSDDGARYLAYCHNCGNGGWLKARGNPPRKYFTEWASYSEEPYMDAFKTKLDKAFFQTPKDVFSKTWETSPLTPAAKLWLETWRLDEEAISVNRIHCAKHRNAYDEQRIMFPVFDTNGDLIFAQMRSIESHPTWKVISWSLDKVRRICVDNNTLSFTDGFHAGPTPKEYREVLSRTAVVVEDRISSIRVNMIGATGICLHGTHVTESELASILALDYDNYVVWLDNDSQSINEKADNIVKRMKLIDGSGKTITRVETEAEPKRQTEVALANKLISVIHGGAT